MLQETLYMLKRGLFSVGPAREAYQVIDVGHGLLQNVIMFGENSEKMLIVNSFLKVRGQARRWHILEHLCSSIHVRRYKC